MEEQNKEEAKETEEEEEEIAETAQETEAEEALEKKEEEEKEEGAPAEEVEAEAKEAEVSAPAEEEAKPPSREKKEEEIVEERTYTIPLGKALIMPPRKRSPRAMRMIRSFMVKHMKLEARKEGEGEEEEEPKKLIISNEVNEKVWGRGVEKPPRKIRVRAAKDKDGNVTVYLAEGD